MKKIMRNIGTILPYKESLRKNIIYAGHHDFDMLPLIGIVFISSIVLAMIAAPLMYFFTNIGLLISIATFLLIIISPQIAVHLKFLFEADKRGTAVETILPDALQIMASNIRSGMTIDRAIWLSARPEFGPLEYEIKRMSTEVVGSSTIEDALTRMTYRIKSKSLDRAIKLIVEGLKGGGEMANLLDHVAEDIRNFQSLVEENRANTTTYTIFIFIAAMFGAPFLFAISTFFIDTIGRIFSSRDLPDLSNVGFIPINVTDLQVDTTTVMIFSVTAIATITFFASLLMGLVRTGNEKNGLKFAPIMMAAGVGIFFLVRFAISSLFANIIPV